MATDKTPASDFLFDDFSSSSAHSEELMVPTNDSLEQIQDDLRHSHTCGVCQPGMPIVFGVGPAPTSLMLIGEGPGIDDIPTQEPFCGQAGVLLNRMLAAINQARSSVYICNVIKCIPPGERKFSVEEIEDCRPLLLRQILVVQPKVIVAFGALAAQTLLRTKKTISELRGQQFAYKLNDLEATLIPTFNPAYLLRVAEKKREAWEDLKLVRDILGRS
ncbi:MAG TPA: uracil-DNA glycosylase [Blastocatellia bacterium]|nr:uracil-DNA glycosylase [Blastocatellia bacterium]